MSANETESRVGETPEVSPKKPRRKVAVIGGVIAAVIVVAGAGFWVWHEQPSFCGAICHTPMDGYLATYEQDPNTEGSDKWGNEVSNTSAMLATTHRLVGATCLDCHKPTMAQQISEGVKWVTGDYAFPLHEASLSDLSEATGTDSKSICLNEACHDMTREDLLAETADLERNPHSTQHGEADCSDCHKVHRASVMACSECHNDSEIPEGWLTHQESKALRA